MFVPANDQADLKKRISDIEELRHAHDKFRKSMDVRVKVLENENTLRKGEISVLSDELKTVKITLEKIRIFTTSTQSVLSELSQKIDTVAFGLNDLANRKLDLAVKIIAAQKRLDETEKP